MLKRHPTLTEQAKAAIKQRILDDEFDDGRIPAETELALELGVSRTTIRDALSRLEIEGSIYRKQGAGTFVNWPGLRVKSRLEEIWSYEAMLEAHGYEPSVEVLALHQERASAEIAAELDIAAGAPLWCVRKLFRQDAEPVILTHNAIPATLLTGELAQADARLPVYDLLQQQGTANLAFYLTDIVPVSAESTLAVTLNIAPGTPIISFEEIGYDQDHAPVVKATSYFRDDLLRLRLMRRNANTP
jgi:DNA-binding GntR family transcriptional regulator